MAARKSKASSSPPARIVPFPGFSKKGMTWLRQIPKNNTRDWFMAHKPTFETEVKEATESLVAALGIKMATFAPQYVPPEAKKAVQRVYRDVRFSKDKSPYKTSMGAKFGRVSADGKAGGVDDCAGFWFSLSAQGVDVVGGSYAPGGPQLAALRAHIAANHKALSKLLARKPLRDAMGELQGEQLKRAPKGFDPEHIAIELLRHKQLYLHTHLPAKLLTTPDLQKEILRRFKLLLPFTEFLNEGLLAAK
jgi:uncharacterized protein (TIGR02453 family)